MTLAQLGHASQQRLRNWLEHFQKNRGRMMTGSEELVPAFPLTPAHSLSRNDSVEDHE